ncbi:MAG: hypothetical protein RL274_430 [Pseudomonadota bacterium]
MAVLDQHDRLDHKTNRCAAMFCLTWVAFFAAIGLLTYLFKLL